jgi:hypothetical protein
MIIIIVLKLNSKIILGKSLGQRSRLESWVGLTRVYVRIKMIIIIFLKYNSGVDMRKLESRVRLRSGYYHCFKNQLGG